MADNPYLQYTQPQTGQTSGANPYAQYVNPLETTAGATSPPLPPTPARFGPQAAAALAAAPPSDALSLSDVPSMINAAARGGTFDVADKFAAAMDAAVPGFSNFFGENVPTGGTWHDRYLHQLQHYKDLSDQFAAKHPLAAALSYGTGAVGAGLGMGSTLGIGPKVGGMIAGAGEGVANAPANASLGETALSAGTGAAVGLPFGYAAGKLAPYLSELGSQVLNRLNASPEELAAARALANQRMIATAPAGGAPVLAPLVKGAGKVAGGVTLGMHGEPGAGLYAGFEGLSDLARAWMNTVRNRAAARAGAAAAAPAAHDLSLLTEGAAHLADQAPVGPLGAVPVTPSAAPVVGALNAKIAAQNAPRFALRQPTMQLAFPGGVVGPPVAAQGVKSRTGTGTITDPSVLARLIIEHGSTQ